MHEEERARARPSPPHRRHRTYEVELARERAQLNVIQRQRGYTYVGATPVLDARRKRRSGARAHCPSGGIVHVLAAIPARRARAHPTSTAMPTRPGERTGGCPVHATVPDAHRVSSASGAAGETQGPGGGNAILDPIVSRLYYMPRTRSSRVLWLLAEIGAPYDLAKVAPEQRRSAGHLARHPLGRVPALELDDGTVMFESAAICLQLADLNPDAGLIPPLGSAERALVYQWVLFAMTELEAPLFRWIRDTTEESTDRSARDRFAQAAAALETTLHDRDWLVGNRFSVADVLCASVLEGAHARGLLEEWPGLRAYVERGEARPAFAAAAAISNQPPAE